MLRRDFLKLAQGLVAAATLTVVIPWREAAAVEPASAAFGEDLTQNPAAIEAVNQFVQALTKAGVKLTAADLLKQGFREVPVGDVKIAFLTISDEDKTIAGEYPILIKAKKGWKKIAGKDAADLAGLDSFGSLVEWRKDSALYTQLDKLYGEQFNLGVATFLWRDQHPKTGEFNNAWPDWEISRAKKRGIKNYRLHALLFRGEGAMAYEGFTRDQLIKEVDQTIESEMKNFIKQGVREFVVVNESFYPNSGREDLFQRIIGDDYVTLAFRKARSVAQGMGKTDIRLIYNDYQNQYSANAQTKHTQATIASLKKENLVDGVGVQMHLKAAEGIKLDDITNTLSTYGVPVYVTEMSIDMTGITDPKKRASLWGQTVQAILASGNCRSISVWGIGDQYSWEASNRKKDAKSTLYDDEMQPKLELYSVIKALVDSIL